ncbi:hypothetical protein HBH56_105320 [Parastagonospora nodorum]|uniref:Gylcosyl hydrolase 115 C-terminal domain-containing protein n=1 Tax=Phaeosphaeria nodorum (strain SN15 / ATCC MYA-4574 / FGSC 10173) TaxID=321614 RepID=A0A7U2FGA8_PHANO|nr:hypothetical protein HBH56_105320 [Parastagonospora nodorum]QRD04748.1 hypothetical protein JI435_106840 [Parastagonospora nodorum SN15]KAH3929542.1 hypothetical protein HBH54_125090 [Parastagonospora nodorum]KAH3951756.1 hypothetical protein HBH53_059090 [Parastagonospora nodorum]KAH4032342.1 hypothetical protein HBI09_117610 [Parastagonospora nodorum]
MFASCSPTAGAISLLDAPIIVDREDFKGVHIAARNLSDDIAKITNKTPPTVCSEHITSPCVIILGSLRCSRFIQQLVSSGKLHISEIEEKWETWCTQIVDAPWDGCTRALVITGSDKRGTIFGTYALSEQIGVSPWYWWADVPVKTSPNIYALNVKTAQGPPAVGYRGIFINDEAPNLSAWVHEKYGPKYNSEFYKRVFELLLRLKANLLWPAMWFGFPHPGNSFFVDDPLNQRLADEYGIVISTSHHEPMQRAMNEWFDTPYKQPENSWSWVKNKEKITRYFEEGAQRAANFESLITIGMRVDGDREMNVENPQEVLKEVLATQRRTIKDAYGQEDAVPQLIALYKEVQEYYENGLKVPEDVTLLFADDNFGTIRRLPTEKPRSYKWLNSNSLGKVWHQLDQAHRRGADEIWIFNVGDIKPLEVPLSFVMLLAWDVNSWKFGDLPAFFHQFSASSFGQELASPCGDLLLRHDKLVRLRKHEHIEPETFSLINYAEADKILSDWTALLHDAEALHTQIPSETSPSFFQLVLHPTKASQIYISLQVHRARNLLYAKQRRNTANHFFDTSIAQFKADFALSQEYHALLDGKWNHIMRQPHLGYRETWHAPSRDVISGLCLVQAHQASNPIAGNIGVAVEGHEGVRPGLCNEESDRTHPSRRDLVAGVTLPVMEPFGPQSRRFDLSLRGPKAVKWTILSPVSWVSVQNCGVLDAKDEHDAPIDVTVKCKDVPADFEGEVLLTLETDLGDFEHIHIPIINRRVPAEFSGHVEADRVLSIPASRFANQNVMGVWKHPHFGREASGSVSFRDSSVGKCELVYPFYTFTSTPKAILHIYFTLTLDTHPGAQMTYGLSLDGKSFETHRLVQQPTKPGELPAEWLGSVMDCVWVRKHEVDMMCTGSHVLRVVLRDENMVSEKIVVDLGGLRESYLGPPESHYSPAPNE